MPWNESIFPCTKSMERLILPDCFMRSRFPSQEQYSPTKILPKAGRKSSQALNVYLGQSLQLLCVSVLTALCYKKKKKEKQVLIVSQSQPTWVGVWIFSQQLIPNFTDPLFIPSNSAIVCMTIQEGCNSQSPKAKGRAWTHQLKIKQL